MWYVYKQNTDYTKYDKPEVLYSGPYTTRLEAAHAARIASENDFFSRYVTRYQEETDEMK